MAIKDLIISSKDLLEETVEGVIGKLFKYNEDGEILIANKKFWKLKGEEKVLRYLAAVAGRQFLDLKNPEIGLNSVQISKALNINNNSVRAYLSQLRSRGMIETEKGSNSVTTQGLHDLIEKEDDDND